MAINFKCRTRVIIAMQKNAKPYWGGLRVVALSNYKEGQND